MLLQGKKTELSYAGLSGRVSPYCVPETSSSNEELDILYPLDLFCSVGAQNTRILWGRQK